MSVTRFLSLFLALALLVALCCIPCFAASEFLFIYDSDLPYFPSSNVFVPAAGDYSYTFDIFYDGQLFFSQSGVCNLVLVDIDGFLVPMVSLNLTIGSEVEVFTFLFAGNMLGVTLMEWLYGGLINIEKYSVLLSLEKLSHPSFVDGVTAGIDGVIGWIQQVTSSLTTGSLLPLLGLMAVAICITGVLFSVKFIRKTSWGH